MLRWLSILITISAALSASTDPTPFEREAELRAQVEALDPLDTSTAAEEARFAYAELLTFTLERDFPTAINLLDGLLARVLAATPPNAAELASVEHVLAHARFYAGQPQDRVEPLLLSALARRRSVFGELSNEVLTTRANLAIFYGQTGRPDLSETELRAVALARQAQDPDADTTLQTRTNWSIILGRLGRFDEAEVILRDVVARRAKLIGPLNPDLAHQLNLLAWVLYSTGRSADAVPVLEHVVALREASLGPDAAKTLTARNNLAATLERLGRFDEAETLIRADLARVSANPTPSERDIADYHYALGKLALHRGDPDESVTEFSRAAETYAAPQATGWQNTEGRDLELTLRWLALALHTRAEPADADSAKAAAAHWLDLLETQFRLHLGYTSEADRLGFAAQERPFDLPATLGDADLLARAVVRLQGLSLDSLIEDAALASAASDPATTALLRRYREALAAPTPAPASNVGDDASSDPLDLPLLDQLEKDLTQRLGGSRLPRQALQTKPAAVLAALPPAAALVNFVRYAIPDPRQPTALPEHYLALLGTAAGGWQIVPLGPAAAIDDLVERYQILTTASGPAAWATELRARVLDPVRAALPLNVTTLCLVPDGALHRINFATLPEADGQTFAIQHHRYLWLNSARELLRPHAVSTALSNATTVRIIASPALSGRFVNLPPLPGATREIDALRQTWPETVVLSGEDATPAAALAAPVPQILHFAAHGFWARDDADHRSSLHQAGIALAGPEGLLTAAQIATADWSTVELVAITACGSGQGAVRDGEGVLGLRRALARTGVHQALLALWPLDDEVTGDLLTHFYTTLATGISPIEAYEQTLRAALPRLASQEGVSTTLRRAGALIMVGAP